MRPQLAQDRRSGQELPLTFPGSSYLPFLAIAVVIWLLTTAAKADLLLALGTALAASVLFWLAQSSRRKGPRNNPEVRFPNAEANPKSDFRDPDG